MEVLIHMKRCHINFRYNKLQYEAVHTVLFYLTMKQFEVQRRYFQAEFEFEDFEIVKDDCFYKFNIDYDD